MAVSTWTESDTVKAEQIWSAYQKQHDLSTCIGKTVGIDPDTGRILKKLIGESIPCCFLNGPVQKHIIAKEGDGDCLSPIMP